MHINERKENTYVCIYHTEILNNKNMLKFHIPYYKKFILLFCLLSKLFITFFFKALAFFSSLSPYQGYSIL